MSRPYGFYDLPYNARMTIDRLSSRASQANRSRADASYWREAYETLVKQTGRDLNDGLGLDPRKRPA